jgi:lysophospholipase L1-like esterase
MRTLQAILAPIALGAATEWCAPSQPPPLPPATAPSVAPVFAAETPPARPATAPTLPPSPLVSRSKRVVGASAHPYPQFENVNDGNYSTPWNAGRPTPDAPAWIAIDVGFGPERVLVNWSAAGSYNYEETDYGSPGAYRIETSADSTDGADGSWRTAVEVSAVSVHGQMHGVDFVGQRWVKFVVTKTPDVSPNGVQVSELDVHDITAGALDSWFFAGDSITAMAFDRAPAHQPSFAAWEHDRHPAYFPAMVNAGTGGHKSDEGAARIDDWLARSPDAHFWAIAYGTNDAAGNATSTERFRSNMQTMVARVRAAGRVPILASIPFATDDQHRHIPSFNRVIDELRETNALPAGPDFYRWFEAHPDELRDGVHPNDRGIVSMNRLWGEAVDALYAR